jgi:Ca2+-binding RTX toxin-like protein
MLMTFKQRQCALAIAVAALTGAWVSSAPAATVAVDGDTIAYHADYGEENALTVRDDGVQATFSDAGASIRPGAGCAAQASGAVACDTGTPGSRVVDVDVRDRDDTVDADTSAVQAVRIAGGSGDDTLHSGSASGERHVLDGGSGDDSLTTSVNLLGAQVLIGGAGDDTAWAQAGGAAELIGNSGDDTLHYTQRAPGQTPSRMDGGSDNDLYLWEGPDPFDAQFPARAIVPGGGFDTLKADLGPFGGGITVDLAACGGCVERVIGSQLDDVLLGDSRPDVLVGRGGNDVIDPRGGPDLVDAGAGDDTINTRDGTLDLVTCGEGLDSLRADGRNLDHAGSSCETVLRAAH